MQKYNQPTSGSIFTPYIGVEKLISKTNFSFFYFSKFLNGCSITNHEVLLTGKEPFALGKKWWLTGGEPLLTGKKWLLTSGEPLLTGKKLSLTGGEPFISGQEWFCTGKEPFRTDKKSMFSKNRISNLFIIRSLYKCSINKKSKN